MAMIIWDEKWDKIRNKILSSTKIREAAMACSKGKKKGKKGGK